MNARIYKEVTRRKFHEFLDNYPLKKFSGRC